MTSRSSLSPEYPPDHTERWKAIAAFWNAVSSADDPGETTWEVLEDLQRQVTECRMRVPPDIGWAEALTALAALKLTGQVDS
jgi:hypothetical protein